LLLFFVFIPGSNQQMTCMGATEQETLFFIFLRLESYVVIILRHKNLKLLKLPYEQSHHELKSTLRININFTFLFERINMISS